MAATPQLGTFYFQTKRGTARAVRAYFSDVANGNVNLNSGASAAATSDVKYNVPEDMYLTDFVITTGMADTTGAVPTIDNAPMRNQRFLYADHLNTSGSGRPPKCVYFPKGSTFGAIQQ